MLTSIGGIIGVIAGIILSKIVSQLSGAPTAISIPAIIGSVLFSMLIGVVWITAICKGGGSEPDRCFEKRINFYLSYCRRYDKLKTVCNVSDMYI